MGTRASIKITDRNDTFWVYRGHDGFPENILPDLQKVAEDITLRVSGPDAAMFTTRLIAEWNHEKYRLPNYELTTGRHGDESYDYTCRWDETQKRWICEEGAE